MWYISLSFPTRILTHIFSTVSVSCIEVTRRYCLFVFFVWSNYRNRYSLTFRLVRSVSRFLNFFTTFLVAWWLIIWVRLSMFFWRLSPGKTRLFAVCIITSVFFGSCDCLAFTYSKTIIDNRPQHGYWLKFSARFLCCCRFLTLGLEHLASFITSF